MTIWEDAVGHTAQEVLPEPARQADSIENVVKEIEEEMARAAELSNEESWEEEGDASCRPHTQDITEADVRNEQELSQEDRGDAEDVILLESAPAPTGTGRSAVEEPPVGVENSAVADDSAGIENTETAVRPESPVPAESPAAAQKEPAELVAGSETALQLEEREMEPERKLIEFSQRLFRPMMRPERFYPVQHTNPAHPPQQVSQANRSQLPQQTQLVQRMHPSSSTAPFEEKSADSSAEPRENVSFGQESIPQPQSPELENPEVLKYLQETEELAADPEKLWMELRRSYPKIQPFDYDNGCEILTIRPQDIGRLPRESWVYGNNSFLLHGDYNIRYLILVRLGSKSGRPRYLIGVPGHYYSNEKYMATMFGFPNFVLSKKQPPNDGRFGYWYTDIRIR